MLPFLRIIPVGGVFLAIMIVVLAHEPPGGSHAALAPAEMPARGALMRMNEHPEWRQFLIQAAVRRADELSRLRELPDTPVRDDSAPEADKVAGLPTSRSDSDPDETETGNEMPSATLPLEIGATSSVELPVTMPKQKPPEVKMTPERKTPSETRRKTSHRPRHAKTPAKTQPAAQHNLLETIFGGQRASQPAAQSAPVSTIRAEQY